MAPRVGARFLLIAMVLAMIATPARAGSVIAYALPAGFSIETERETRAITIGPDGAVTAIVARIEAPFPFRAVRWTAQGMRSMYVPLAVLPGSTARNERPIDVDALAAGDAVAYITAASTFSGAYTGTSTNVQRWTHGARTLWQIPACVHAGQAQDAHAYGADANGQVALTVDMTGSFMVMRDEQKPGKYAPYAFVITGSRCRALGRAVVLNVRGRWAAGYRGYLEGHLAPTNLNIDSQHFVAVRWNGSELRELGNGAALAVNSSGFAVGASAIPGRLQTAPHAVAWERGGRLIALEKQAERSVAYDVADNGTVVGTLRERDGRHYAFRWRDGRRQRLDDLAHPTGWRFESAYAIRSDGAIAGIGTLRGIATVFVWHDDAH